jgi:hypothetical protein
MVIFCLEFFSSYMRTLDAWLPDCQDLKFELVLKKLKYLVIMMFLKSFAEFFYHWALHVMLKIGGLIC